jgi:hypothetical protein
MRSPSPVASTPDGERLIFKVKNGRDYADDRSDQRRSCEPERPAQITIGQQNGATDSD